MGSDLLLTHVKNITEKGFQDQAPDSKLICFYKPYLVQSYNILFYAALNNLGNHPKKKNGGAHDY